ncbi:MAG: 4-hydroxy-tetrahydrodipicolinate synthase [Phascolarctobacterium sp.]|nr:4-hydroxy-tetrahydrodipicolinate synthase [Phascolarctobacterium sp.]
MAEAYFGRLLTAMVTPFNEDGSINCEAAADFAEWLLANGSDGLVVEGSTGEAATMFMDEKIAVLRAVVERVNGRAPVIVGAGTNCTASTIELINAVEACGVDGLLVVGPYYNKPTQEGYYQHFAAVAKSTSLPIIVYNVPGRTGSNIEPKTIARLAAEFPNIVAVKEAAGNVAQTAELFRVLPDNVTIYSGDDGLVLPFMSVGARGVISVLGNIGGQMLQDVMRLYSEGKVAEAAELNKKLVPLASSMFIESNPIPVKYAVTKVTGIYAGNPRLPLTPLSAANAEKLDAILAEYGLI